MLQNHIFLLLKVKASSLRTQSPRNHFETSDKRIKKGSSFCLRPSSMSPIMGSRSTLLLVALTVAIAVLPGAAEGFSINGRVKIPGLAAKAFGISGKISDAKVNLNGGSRITFLRPDGYFSFHNISAGTHLIEVSAIGYFFSPVRVDVSARNPGKVQAALTENRRSLSELVFEPLGEQHYYEIRQPFSVMSLVKSPMGLMVGFMLFAMFLMPKLAENMDPEEIRRTQEEMRNQGIPSLANMLPGAAR